MQKLSGSKRTNAATFTEPPRCFRSPLRYPGGKQKALDQIARLLPSSATEFREPMVGGGSVFLHARSGGLAEKYWINDQFAELVAFWKVAADPQTCKRLMDDLESLRRTFSSAQEIKKFFLQVRQEAPADLYRQALLFFFFNRVTFSGTTRAGGFSQAASMRRFTASSIERLGPLPEALAGVKITQSDYEEVIRAPGKDVFIFLDPPYFKASKLYGMNGRLHKFDHQRLARTLQESSHRFLLTYDDCDEIRQLYRWAKINGWKLQYGMNNCNVANTSKVGSELFIRNY